MCPGLNSLSHAHSHMDSHMLNWEIDIENRKVCHSWHPYDAKHSVQVAAADSCIGLRDTKATKFKLENVDFTWALLHFFKVVGLFWKKSPCVDLMVHHETPRHCYPCCATFFWQVANNMNCEASSAATNATSVAYDSVARAVLNRQLACFPSKPLKIIRVRSMSLIFRVASKSILMYSLEMLKVWLQETSGTVCPVSWMHFTVTCWQHLNHPIQYPHRSQNKLSWPSLITWWNIPQTKK